MKSLNQNTKGSMLNIKSTKITLLILRLSMGWLMLYAGITKVIDPEWSAAGYLGAAKTFPGFFNWLASDQLLPFINFINEWGLTLLGVSLILGVFVRLSSVLGAILMLLYFLPVLDFPYAGYGFLVDEHIIYALVLILFAVTQAGRDWGLDAKIPKLSKWLG